MENKEEPEMIPVDVRFLQALLEYLSTRPYSEVHKFIDPLTGKGQFQQENPEGGKNE